MREGKEICPFCKTEQNVAEDPNVSAESLAYGSNKAGLRFVKHDRSDGTPCKYGSGYVMQ